MKDFLDLFRTALPKEIDWEQLKILASAQLWQENPQEAAIRVLKRSELFDQLDYLARYPDVQLSQSEPIRHFVVYGLSEQRFFKTKKSVGKKYKRPKVSVLIPVYNNAQYLHECLQSVIRQTLQELEIIILDDGSTDPETTKILDHYAHNDKRIRLIHKKNTGYGHSMNLGLDLAQGQYVGIVESDDYITETFYEDLYQIAEKEQVDFVKADFYRFVDGATGQREFYLNKLSEDTKDYQRIIDPQQEQRVFSFVMNTWSGIYNLDFLRKYKIKHNTSPGASFQDTTFWFQTFMFANKIYFVDKAYYMNRRDNKNSSVYDQHKIWAFVSVYDYLYTILEQYPNLKSKMLPLYQFYRYRSYMAAINRSANDDIYEFIQKFRHDYAVSQQKGELDLSCFSEGGQKTIHLILQQPDVFYRKKLAEKQKQAYQYGIGVQITQSSAYKISVIMPVFNGEKTLIKALDSALAQDLKEIEIICINDGSTDQSWEVLQTFATKHKNVILRQQNNQGAGVARNLGLELARGEFVAFLDCDDYYPDQTILSTLYKKAQAHKVQICGGSFSTWKNGTLQTEYEDTYKLYTFTEEKKIAYRDYQFDYGYHRFIYQIAMLKKNKILFPVYRRFQDPVFFVKAMLCAKEFYAVPMITYCYSKHPKKLIWTKEKIYDLVAGIRDNLLLSKEHKLAFLHKISLGHLNKDFCQTITSFLQIDNLNLLELLCSVQKALAKELLEEKDCVVAPLQFLFNQVKA